MRRLSLFVLAILLSAPLGAQRAALSSKPDTPFKLATFEAAGKTRVGLVLGSRVLDIAGANAELTQKAGVPADAHPGRDARADRGVPARVAAALSDRELLQGREGRRRAVRVRRRRRSRSRRRSNIPYNLLAAAANYKLHAGEMFAPGSPQQKAALEADPGQGRSGVLRQVAAVLHHRSRRAVHHAARTQHRLGRRAGDHHRQAGVQRHRSAGARLRVRLQRHVRPQRSRRHRRAGR